MSVRLDLARGRWVSVRAATSAEGRAAMPLVFEVLAEYGLKGEPDATDACMQDVERNYAARGGSFEVVRDETGALVGCYGLYPHGEGIVELRKMYLRRDVRGIGLGRALMERALAEAARLGFREIELDTASQLKEAIALYERFGFERVTRAGIPARCDLAMRRDV